MIKRLRVFLTSLLVLAILTTSTFAAVQKTIQSGTVSTINVNSTSIATGTQFATIQGSTETNLCGSYGDFETDSNSNGLADGFTIYNGGASIATDVYILGSKSQVIAPNAYVRTADILSPNKYYFATAYIYGLDAMINNYNNAGTIDQSSVHGVSGKWKRAGIKIQTASTVTFPFIQLSTGLTENSVFDGLLVTEISASDYALTVDQLLAKDPFINGTQSSGSIKAMETGKNLIPNGPKSLAYNGITITKDEDGSITLNGTCSAYFYYDVFTGLVQTVNPKKPYPNGNYTITSYNISGSVTGSFSLDLMDINNSIYYDAQPSSTPRIVNVNNGIGTLSSYIGAGTVFNNYKFYPQLELGSTATSYVPYTAKQFCISNISLAGNDGVYDTLDYYKNQKGVVTFNWYHQPSDWTKDYLLTALSTGTSVDPNYLAKPNTKAYVDGLDSSGKILGVETGTVNAYGESISYAAISGATQYRVRYQLATKAVYTVDKLTRDGSGATYANLSSTNSTVSVNDSTITVKAYASIPIRSVGGVKDGFNLTNGTMTQNVKAKILQASDVMGMRTDYSNIDYAYITIPSDSILKSIPAGLTGVGKSILEGYKEIAEYISNWDSSNYIGCFSAQWDTSTYYVGFVKGTTLDQAKTALAGKTLTYQLTTQVTQKFDKTLFNNGVIGDTTGIPKLYDDNGNVIKGTWDDTAKCMVFNTTTDKYPSLTDNTYFATHTWKVGYTKAKTITKYSDLISDNLAYNAGNNTVYVDATIPASVTLYIPDAVQHTAGVTLDTTFNKPKQVKFKWAAVSGANSYKIYRTPALSTQIEAGGLNSSTGLEQADATKIRSKNYIKIYPNKTYILDNDKGYTVANVYYYDGENYVSMANVNFNSFTVPNNNAIKYCRFEVTGNNTTANMALYAYYKSAYVAVGSTSQTNYIDNITTINSYRYKVVSLKQKVESDFGNAPYISVYKAGLSKPVANYKAGTYTQAIYVTLSGVSGKSIEYSTNGGASWLPYTKKIKVATTTTITARIVNEPATTISYTYTMNIQNLPSTFNISSAVWNSADGSVNLTWPVVSGAVRYQVYRSTSAGGYFSLISDYSITGTSFSDDSVQTGKGKTYCYKVKAINKSYRTVYSAVKSVKVP